MLRRWLGMMCILGAVGIAGITSPKMNTINGEKPILLKTLHITSSINGPLAKTTMRMEFYNPNTRPLEGSLEFPLTPSQQIVGFALDLNGKMRAAVPVEKEKGRVVFEAIERRNVDPAVLEKTQGENFKIRVYPINAHATRIVEVSYMEHLSAPYRYVIPLGYTEAIEHVRMEIDVQGFDRAPKESVYPLKFRSNEKGGYHALWEGNSTFLKRPLELAIEGKQTFQTVIESYQGETYFMGAIPLTSTQTRTPSSKIAIVWDASTSGASRDHRAELALLERYFATLQEGEVELIFVRDRSTSGGHFTIHRGEWSALRKVLESVKYDGASALGSWNVDPTIGEYLLFSDGLLNYAQETFPTLNPKQVVYAIDASMQSDFNRLDAWARRYGGKAIKLSSTNVESAFKALMYTPKVWSITSKGIDDLVTWSDDEVVWFMGVLSVVSGEVMIRVDDREQRFPIHNRLPHAHMVAYAWARTKIRDLEVDGWRTKGEVRRLGERFGIPTGQTSLIVLDDPADYVRYDITPPAEIADAVREIQSRVHRERTQAYSEHLERVVREFNEKVAWWEKKYPKGNPPRDKEAKVFPVTTSTGAMMRNQEMAMDLAVPAPMMEARAVVAMPKGMAHDEVSNENAPTITLKKWSSNAPYVQRMRSVAPDQIYMIYLDEKPDYAMSSGFFLDVADLLLEKNRREEALLVLSNLAEISLEDRHLLRILGYRLMQANAPELAIPIFERVVRIAGEEPQSFRDLGLAYAAAKEYQKAIDTLNEVITRTWDSRFSEIELIVLADMNSIIATAPTPLNTSGIDPRLLKNLPVDLRVVLTWDADNSDMDLWVTDPNGEKCYYGNRFTYQGGRLSRDFTGGYGPEEFSLRVAKAGKYKVEANFFGSREQSVAEAVTLQLKFFTQFGTRKEALQTTTLRLNGRGETVFVGEFEVK